MVGRKVIQITTGTYTAYIEDEEDERQRHHLYALCEDGTVWVMKRDTWQQMPDIPQDKSQMTGKARDAEDSEGQGRSQKVV